jgi:hypothetical protein
LQTNTTAAVTIVDISIALKLMVSVCVDLRWCHAVSNEAPAKHASGHLTCSSCTRARITVHWGTTKDTLYTIWVKWAEREALPDEDDGGGVDRMRGEAVMVWVRGADKGVFWGADNSL